MVQCHSDSGSDSDCVLGCLPWFQFVSIVKKSTLPCFDNLWQLSALQVTVKSWTRELDPNRKWLRYDTQMVKGKDTVTKITCEVCQTHQSRLRALRNFSRAFIEGIM